jgi:2-dehydropantoate 2-reductase
VSDPTTQSRGRVISVGAGAIGSTLVLALAPRRRAIILDPDPAVRAAWTARGHTSLGPGQLPAEFDAQPDDLAIIATRATVADAALASLPPHLTVLCVSNGLNPALGRHRSGATLAGVVDFAATCDRPGEPRATQRGSISMPAESPTAGGVTRALAADLAGSPITAHLADRIEGHLWSKLLLNSSLDPVAAITGQTLGGVFARRPAFLLMRRLLREGRAVALAAGVPLEPVQGSTIATMDRVFHTPGINRLAAAIAARKAVQVQSTMTADWSAGRTTEAEFLNGFVVREAARLGIPAPAHSRVLTLLNAPGPRPANIRDDELLALARG